MIAAIIETKTILKVILWSLVSGIGIAVIFGTGVASMAGLLDAARERRSAAVAGWATLALICLVAAIAAVVLGIVVVANG